MTSSFVGDGELLAPFLTAARQDLTTFLGRHPGTETVLAGALDAGRMISGLHEEILKFEIVWFGKGNPIHVQARLSTAFACLVVPCWVVKIGKGKYPISNKECPNFKAVQPLDSIPQILPTP